MTKTKPTAALGINHLVLNVRDIEASHTFYTEALGFEFCGELGPKMPMTMRFYRTAPDHHHDLALVQMAPEAAAAPVPDWSLMGGSTAINHYAVCWPDSESWLAQLAHLRAIGVEFKVRGDHGMTRSAYVTDPDGNGIEVLYEVPAEAWEGDVNAALNYFKPIDPNSDEAFQDTPEYKRFG